MARSGSCRLAYLNDAHGNHGARTNGYWNWHFYCVGPGKPSLVFNNLGYCRIFLFSIPRLLRHQEIVSSSRSPVR